MLYDLTIIMSFKWVIKNCKVKKNIIKPICVIFKRNQLSVLCFLKNNFFSLLYFIYFALFLTVAILIKRKCERFLKTNQFIFFFGFIENCWSQKFSKVTSTFILLYIYLFFFFQTCANCG